MYRFNLLQLNQNVKITLYYIKIKLCRVGERDDTCQATSNKYITFYGFDECYFKI